MFVYSSSAVAVTSGTQSNAAVQSGHKLSLAYILGSFICFHMVSY